MTVVFQQMPEESGDVAAQKVKHKWCLTGALGDAADLWVFDRDLALNYALGNIPSYLLTSGLFRENVSPSTPGGLLWYFDVEYGPIPKLGEWRVSFDTTGGTIHQTHSRAVVHAYTYGKNGPTGDTEQAKVTAIGHSLKDGAIAGTDVVIPVEKRTYTYRHKKGMVTEAYMDYIATITGVTNSTPWHNRQIGEVLFLGCKGSTSPTGIAECDLAYDFALGKNIVSLSLGTSGFDQITGIEKGAHQYLDVTYEPEVVDAKAGAKIAVIRIHRIYEALNFYTYLGF